MYPNIIFHLHFVLGIYLLYNWYYYEYHQLIIHIILLLFIPPSMHYFMNIPALN